MGEQRNLFVFIAVALVILLGYQTFVTQPAAERARQEREAQEAVQDISEGLDPALPSTDGAATPPPAVGDAATLSRADALAQTDRVPVETPEASGSISLTGARLDDLALTTYTRELDPESGVVTLMNPAGAPGAYYTFAGWSGTGFANNSLPGPTTQWRLVEGDRLTPSTPVTLAYDSPEGLLFERRITVDEHYMFTLTDRVTNRTGAGVAIAPYGVVRRRGIPEDATGFYILHEGLIGVFGNDLIMRKYKRMQNDEEYEHRGVGGWLGISDKYWLAAVLPGPNVAFDGEFRVVPRADAPLFQASWLADAYAVADGEVIETTSRMFAGAKRAELLRDYKDTLGIPRFDWAIDWGNFFFLTQPFFLILEYFAGLTGSFGLAILLLTICVKIATFPLANTSYKSMARMKKLQPKVAELRERYKADPKRQQTEMMQLYQREKVNPLAGCLPIIVQIPIFYALYKTLFVTIEMRHAPFIGWIRDLSAPDPTNIWNLFGLLPYDPAAIPLAGVVIGGAGFLALGALPLLYGISMAAMQTLNPPPPDPTQQKIFAFMPWIFMFVLAQFAAGLLIYWIWNNILSFLQQYVIMRRQGVDTPIGSFLAKRYKALTGGAAGSGTSGGASGDGG